IALLISSLGFSLMSFFVKYSGDLPTVQKTFFRNFISMAIALRLVIYHREKLFGHKENQGMLLLRSSLWLLGVLLNFFVIVRMVLSDEEILYKLSTFITFLLCAIFLKEYIRRYHMISFIVDLVGAVFIINPS